MATSIWFTSLVIDGNVTPTLVGVRPVVITGVAGIQQNTILWTDTNGGNAVYDVYAYLTGDPVPTVPVFTTALGAESFVHVNAYGDNGFCIEATDPLNNNAFIDTVCTLGFGEEWNYFVIARIDVEVSEASNTIAVTTVELWTISADNILNDNAVIE
jgi:hypothetical protein